MATYLFGTRRLSSEDKGFTQALAAAHADRLRPKCLCLVHGIEMYVARLGEGFIAKRMPGTGSRHAPDCPSYEPPLEASGLGQVLGTAIQEDPATGETTLKLGFSLSKLGGRTAMPAPGNPSDSVASDGSRLSLRGLLHYLWDQAELTRWHPASPASGPGARCAGNCCSPRSARWQGARRCAAGSTSRSRSQWSSARRSTRAASRSGARPS